MQIANGAFVWACDGSKRLRALITAVGLKKWGSRRLTYFRWDWDTYMYIAFGVSFSQKKKDIFLEKIGT